MVRVRAGLEAGQVGAALVGVDVVGEGEDLLVVGVVVLHGDFDLHAPLFALEVDRLGVQGGLVAVQVLDEGADAPFVVELVGLALDPLVGDRDPDPGVEEGQLAQALGKDVEGDLGGLEDLVVRHEGDLGAALLGLAGYLQRGDRIAAAIGLAPDLAVAADLQLQPLGEGVDDRDADAVQTAGDLVGVVVELAAGVQHGQDDLGRRFALGGVHVGRDAAAVVDNGHRAVGVDGDADLVAVAGQGLVDGVVDDLVDQVVQAGAGGGADVHGRPLADGGKSFQDLDIVRAVIF